MPRTTGLPLRAATIRSGQRASRTAIPYVPTTAASASRTASSRPLAPRRSPPPPRRSPPSPRRSPPPPRRSPPPPRRSSPDDPGRYPLARAIRCARTSLSVSETNSAPSAISLARNSSAFSMIPLCTTATGPTTCGWALMSFGSPCVAHLVWPMPGPPLKRAGRLDPRPATRVLALCTRNPPDRFATASPAESYPRYSSWASPSSRMGTQSRLPTCATIPHTCRSLSLGRRRTQEQGTHRSAVNDTAKLPQRQLRRSHSPGRHLGRDQRESLLVREPPCLQLTMAPAHELIHGLPEVAKDLGYDPRRLALAERAGANQVGYEFLMR